MIIVSASHFGMYRHGCFRFLLSYVWAKPFLRNTHIAYKSRCNELAKRSLTIQII